jgi:hypothetical protein
MRDAERDVGVFPMRSGRGGEWESLTTPYSCLYRPVCRDAGVAAAFARLCRRRVAVTRLDALPAEWDGLPMLLAGARAAGLVALRFDHFGNWYEDVGGLDWDSYLRQRPGALRETIRRRLRRAEKLPDASFLLLTEPGEMDRAVACFEAVYACSWKEAEPFPTFNAALMRGMAALGRLRFGAWLIGDTPVAVQIWVIEDGLATVLKLAHDEAFKSHSPGTVLTAMMIRRLLDHDAVNTLDFGRGDDGYKKDWAGRRRQRIGVLLVDPLRVAGLAALVRHVAGRGVAWVKA